MQVASDASESTHIKEMTFYASGMERTDPAWISKLWRPECKPEAIENRVSVIIVSMSHVHM